MILIIFLAFIGTLINFFGNEKICSFMQKNASYEIKNAKKGAFKKLFLFETTGLWLTCFPIVFCSFFICFKKNKNSFKH